jgi:predicted ester cyclase
VTAEENKEVIRLMVEAAERGDVQGWMNVWADDARNHGCPAPAERLRLLFTSLRTAFPDRRSELLRVIVEGDLVVAYMRNSGTFGDIPELKVERTEYLTTAPTGASYSVESIHIFRIVNGKIAEHWAVRDDLALLAQLGAITPPQRPG